MALAALAETVRCEFRQCNAIAFQIEIYEPGNSIWNLHSKHNVIHSINFNANCIPISEASTRILPMKKNGKLEVLDKTKYL